MMLSNLATANTSDELTFFLICLFHNPQTITEWILGRTVHRLLHVLQMAQQYLEFCYGLKDIISNIKYNIKMDVRKSILVMWLVL
jgi:hypothetical protein